MKIALIGYGKMGHAIERVALGRGHTIVSTIDADNIGDMEGEAFRSADVAIEFTSPTSAQANVLRCFKAGVPVVSGSTGWTDKLPEVKTLCDDGYGTLLWSSNFSLGVNIFFKVNRELARLMAHLDQYKPSMEEIHHIHKLDHPSGTAINLAEGIIDEMPRLIGWTEDKEAADANESLIRIDHVREGEVPGTHIIAYDSPVDTITIEHRAKSRDGFALGAVIAAEWLAGRTGWHTMGELMDYLTKG